MLSPLPSLFRLSLCLLLSFSMHGGLLYSDWLTSSVASGPAAPTPIAVSFLPAAKLTAPAANGKAPTKPAPAVLSPTPRPMEAKPASRPLAKALTAIASPPRPALKVHAGVESKGALEQSSPSADMFCMLPQDVPFEGESGKTESSESDPVPAGPEALPMEDIGAAAQKVTSGIEKAGLADPVASSPSLIEATPQYRRNPLPEYPLLARQRHWEGVVWLLVDVSEAGVVDHLRVEQSCGHQVLDRSAKRAVSRWRFFPAKRAGLAVSSQVRIPVRFHLEDD